MPLYLHIPVGQVGVAFKAGGDRGFRPTPLPAAGGAGGRAGAKGQRQQSQQPPADRTFSHGNDTNGDQPLLFQF